MLLVSVKEVSTEDCVSRLYPREVSVVQVCCPPQHVVVVWGDTHELFPALVVSEDVEDLVLGTTLAHTLSLGLEVSTGGRGADDGR